MGLAGGLDCGQFRFIEMVAVSENFDAVFGDNVGICKRSQIAHKFVGTERRGEQVPDAIRQFRSEEREVKNKGLERDRDTREDQEGDKHFLIIGRECPVVGRLHNSLHGREVG